jgi:hypothetical protein
MSRRAKGLGLLAIALVAVVIVPGSRRQLTSYALRLTTRTASRRTDLTLTAHPRTIADHIVNGAKEEVLRGVRYDASYTAIPYPNGDVPADRGACTEVIIRGLRNAGYDLQQLIHEDMRRRFSEYPGLWGLKAPDPNIDHRRVPNHLVYMRKHGLEMPRSTSGRDAATWQPGDLVYWRLRPGGPTHCGVISNDRGRGGLPLVIHNIGPVARQEDCLTSWEVIGHYRYPPPQGSNSQGSEDARRRNLRPQNRVSSSANPSGDRSMSRSI